MIIKSYELQKIDIEKNNLLLFYGQNQGAKENAISKILTHNKNKTVSKYEEKEILENDEFFYDSIMSNSLFDNKKIIVINRATDKIIKIIEDILEKNISNISIILNSNILEKKSKIRSLFEKNKNLISVAFYPDTPEILSKFTLNFLRKNNIMLSQSNINLIVNRCNGDRGVLENELEKINFFSKNGKKISTEDLLKLINLIENYSVSELLDNCLAKNQKKTISILNENNYSNEDCIIIIKTLLNKLKRILRLSLDYQENKDLNLTIAKAKPPIFWKDKEIVKQQIIKWSPSQINKLMFDANEVELQIKKNRVNPLNLVSDFVLTQVSLNQ